MLHLIGASEQADRFTKIRIGASEQADRFTKIRIGPNRFTPRTVEPRGSRLQAGTQIGEVVDELVQPLVQRMPLAVTDRLAGRRFRRHRFEQGALEPAAELAPSSLRGAPAAAVRTTEGEEVLDTVRKMNERRGVITRRAIAALTLMLALAAAGPARAARVADTGYSTLDLGGDVKAFFYGIYTYEHFLMPGDPTAQGHLDLRLKFDGGYENWLRYSFHHQATASLVTGTFDLGGAFAPTGGGAGVPEAFSMSWEQTRTESFSVTGRMDRVWIGLKIPHVDITIGRQPISFGTTYFFSPMDLVAPFSPTVVDREYKPGVDAVRVDGYFGTSGKITAVAAYAGDWDLDGLVIAGHGSVTLGTYDVGLFVGSIHRETVFGVDFVGNLGPVGFRGEATLTLRRDHFERKKRPFVRAVLSADAALPENVHVTGEVYYQSFGAADPEDYLALTATDRFERGEVWAMGRWYAALSVSFELTPLVTGSAFAMANLGDGSFLLGPSLSWSIAGNADLVFGGNVGLGKRPDEMELEDFFHTDFTPLSEAEILDAIPVRSEFGLMPAMVYAQMRAYF